MPEKIEAHLNLDVPRLCSRYAPFSLRTCQDPSKVVLVGHDDDDGDEVYDVLDKRSLVSALKEVITFVEGLK